MAFFLIRSKPLDSPRDSGGAYSLLFAANPIPMWLYDVETLRFLEVNQAAVAQYGFSRDEFLGMTLAAIRPPEDVPGLGAAIQATTPTGLRGPFLARHRRKDGGHFTVEIAGQDVVFNERRARLVVAQDVSERERLAADIPRRQQFLQSILDAMPAVVFVKDRQHRFTLVNAAWERFTGVPREQAIGKTAHDIFPAAVADRIRRDDIQTFDADARTEVEESIAGTQGLQVQLTSRFPLRGADGHVEGLVGLAVDITERKRTEGDLQRAKEFAESVIQAANVIFLQLDAAGIVRKVNAAAEEITGYNSAEVQDTSWFSPAASRTTSTTFSA
jgi:PAS domain S-box-containing protein